MNESEFRLVDQMYDVAEVVSAPNGINLSIVYEQMLNNLLPKFRMGISRDSRLKFEIGFSRTRK